MAAESVPLTTPDKLSPDSVAGTTFTASFRGFDQDEVRAFQHRVAELLRAAETREAELRAQLEAAEERAAKAEPVDEVRVAAALGEEAAKILVTARQAAADIRSKAEESAATLVREAQDEANRVRHEADGVLEARTREAEDAASSIRKSAEEEATRKLTDAERRLAEVVAEAEQMRLDASEEAARLRAEADTDAFEIRAEAREAGRIEVEEARRLARESVAEAQVVRERVLTDLAHKRKAARVHLEQLRAGRDRLLTAYDVVRRTLAEATGELEGVLFEAKQAAGIAARRVEEHEGESAELIEAELAAGRLVGLPPAADIAVEVEVDVVTVDSEPAPADVDTDADADAGAETAGVLPTTPEPIHLPPRRDRRGLFRHRRSSVADELPGAEYLPVAPNDPVEEVRVLKGEAAGNGADHGDETRELDVHELFERLKAEREANDEDAGGSAAGGEVDEDAEAEVATESESAADPSESIESPEPGSDAEPEPEPEPEPESESPDEALLARRDSIGDEIEQRLARKLKRVLADEQNEALDGLRRQGGRHPIDLGAVLPPSGTRAANYAEAAASELAAAAVAGRAFAGANGVDAPPVGDLASELATSITERLDERIAAVLHDADGDDDAVADGVRACYREWKSRHLNEAIRDSVVAAFGRGLYDALAADAQVRWLGDDGGPPCPDCEDNALAGVLAKGDTFPTGHRHPPAHPGCRCLVVPAES
jgi:cell division septum initiation protein DivIVA